MKVTTSCMQCLVEGRAPTDRDLSSVAVPDDGVIRMTCTYGHETHSILQEDRFELLSQLAIAAIADGYYREAVASFTASMERLFEFYLRVVWRSRSIDLQVAEDTWKQMASSSERQFGAFVATYLVQEQELARTLASKDVKFRNDVIHKGRFPAYEQAVEFGQAVADVAGPILKRLKSAQYEPHTTALFLSRLGPAYERARAAGVRPSTVHNATFFSLANADLKLDVGSAVAEYAARPKVHGPVSAAALLAMLLEASENLGIEHSVTTLAKD